MVHTCLIEVQYKCVARRSKTKENSPHLSLKRVTESPHIYIKHIDNLDTNTANGPDDLSCIIFNSCYEKTLS